MPFFEGAQNVVINGGKFEQINGDQTIHNRHVYNIDSFNRVNNTTSDSFNNSSTNWRGAGGESRDVRHLERPAQDAPGDAAQIRPNSSRTPSARQNHSDPPAPAPPTPPPVPKSSRPSAGVAASYPTSPHQETTSRTMGASDYANLSEAELQERIQRLKLDLGTTSTSPGGSKTQSPRTRVSRVDADSDGEGEAPRDRGPIATQPLLSSSPSPSPVPSVSIAAPHTPVPNTPTPPMTASPAASAPALLVSSPTPPPPSPIPQNPSAQASAPKKQRSSKNPLRRMKYIFNSKTRTLTSVEMSE